MFRLFEVEAAMLVVIRAQRQVEKLAFVQIAIVGTQAPSLWLSEQPSKQYIAAELPNKLNHVYNVFYMLLP
jgi:hypothetical protein